MESTLFGSELDGVFNPLKGKIKQLRKDFPWISKQDMATLLEYNDSDALKTRALLDSNKKSRIDAFLKKLRINFWDPEVDKYYNELLEGVQTTSVVKKVPPNTHAKEKLQEEEEKSEGKTPEKNKSELAKYHESFLFNIFQFLDPVSLCRIGMTCKYFNNISSKSILYKKFCVAIYSTKVKLPERSVFEKLLELIKNNPGNYSQETRLSASHDIRSIIWLPSIDYFKVSANFFKSFNDWRSMFILAPRLKFGGVYKIKEKYLKQGERRTDQFYTPVFVVDYHRYLRFLPNGLAFQVISTKSIPGTMLRELFKTSVDALLKTDDYIHITSLKKKEFEVLKGEYILKTDLLYLKFFKGDTLYEYKFKMLSSSPGAHDLMVQELHVMREISSGFEVPLGLSQAQSTKLYEFKRIEGLITDLPDSAEKSFGL